MNTGNKKKTAANQYLTFLTFGLVCLPILWFGRRLMVYDNIVFLFPLLVLFAAISEVYLIRYAPHKPEWEKATGVLRAIHQGRIALPLLFFTVIVFNFSVLFGKWTTASPRSYFFLNGGFLPGTDSSSYYVQAKNLIENGYIGARSVWRPLSHCFNATLLKLTGQNLMLAYSIMTLLVSTGIYYAAKTVYNSYGLTAGMLMCYLMCLYYIPFNGTMMTSPAGFLFGTFAFVMLWQGFDDKNILYTLFGVCLVSMALSTRAGAMLVIPMVILALGYVFANANNKFRFNIKYAVLAVILGYAFLSYSKVLLKYITRPGTDYTYQGNLSNTVYGIIVGGKGWRQAERDHPEFLKMDADKRVKLTYKYAFEHFKKHPQVAFAAILKVYATNLVYPFTYLYPFKYLPPKPLFAILLIFSFLGLFYLYKYHSKSIVILMGAALLGIYLSSGILQDAQIRVYSGTMAFPCASIAVGVGGWLKRLKNALPQPDDVENVPKHEKLAHSGLLPAVFVLLIMLFGPFWVLAGSQGGYTFGELPKSCKGHVGVFRITDGSQIKITNYKNRDLLSIPEGKYRSSLLQAQIKQGFGKAKEGEYVITTLNLNRTKTQNGRPPGRLDLILEEDVTQSKKEFAVVCLKEQLGTTVYRADVISYANYEDLEGTHF